MDSDKCGYLVLDLQIKTSFAVVVRWNKINISAVNLKVF